MTKNPSNAASSKWAEGEHRKAVFSPCRTWRYHLQQVWDESKPNLIWLMLNPSTADEMKNDPTVERCEQRARMWDFGGVEVFNLFAFRATNPNEMASHPDPVGPENDKWMAEFARKSKTTLAIIGWGEHGKHLDRGRDVLALIDKHKGQVHALKVNASGHPKHPLYIGYSQESMPYSIDLSAL